MACPYFEPQETLHEPIFARPPLGDAYRGVCHAAPGARELPLKLCNLGYARGRCEHFPASCSVDAHRYSQTSDGRIVWIEEAEYAPLRFGSTQDVPPGAGPLAEQLRAFERAVKEGKIR